jgi:hypothetical protein
MSQNRYTHHAGTSHLLPQNMTWKNKEWHEHAVGHVAVLADEWNNGSNPLKLTK